MKKNWNATTEPDTDSKRKITTTFLGGKTICILDFEADGLDPKSARAFQVSYMVGTYSHNDYTSNHLSDDWIFGSYRIEEEKIPLRYILSLGGEDDTFNSANVLPRVTVFKRILNIVKNSDIVVTFNRSYHFQLFACELERLGLEVPKVYLLDPYVLYSSVYKFAKSKKLIDIMKFYGYEENIFGHIADPERKIKSLQSLLDDMIKDKNMDKMLYDFNDIESFYENQLNQSVLDFIKFAEWHKKQNTGKVPEWNPWPPSPNSDLNKIDEALTEYCPQLLNKFSSEPTIKKNKIEVDIKKLVDDDLSLYLLGVISGEREGQSYLYKIDEIQIKIIGTINDYKNIRLKATFENKDSEFILKLISVLEKFPLSLYGDEKYIWEVIDSKKEDKTTIFELAMLKEIK